MAALPYLPLFPADYLADTQHLTTEQHGAYFLLLMNYWQTGKPLDNSNERLATVARLSNIRWKSVRPSLIPFFQIDSENQWWHGRVEFELARVLKKSEKSSYAGKESARKRRNKEIEAFEREKGLNHSTDVENALNGRSHSVQPKLNQAEAEAEAHTEADKNKRLVQTKFEQFWKIYPRRDGKKKAAISFEKALKVATIEVILEGIEKYVNGAIQNGQIPAMPATWLNGERWNDERQEKNNLVPYSQSSGFSRGDLKRIEFAQRYEAESSKSTLGGISNATI